MAGADLRGASVWMTLPPEWNPNGLTDMSEIAVKPLDAAGQADLKGRVAAIADGEVRARAAEAIAPLLDAGRNWNGSAEQQRWQSWASAPPFTTGTLASPPAPMPVIDTYKSDLTGYLIKAMCSTRWSNGAVATGVARRALAQQFRGDVVAVYDGLKSNQCPASAKMPSKVMRDLSSAAEAARYR
jgi:hypothetical protein